MSEQLEAFIDQAVLVAKHWRGQEGINTHELDKLADASDAWQPVSPAERRRDVDDIHERDPKLALALRIAKTALGDEVTNLLGRDEWQTREEERIMSRALLKLNERLGMMSTRAAGDAEEIHRLRTTPHAPMVAVDGMWDISELIDAQKHSHRLQDELIDARQALARMQRGHSAAGAAIEERIIDIAHENYGPFPVQTPDEALTSIERGSREDHAKLSNLITHADARIKWADAEEDRYGQAGAHEALTEKRVLVEVLAKIGVQR